MVTGCSVFVDPYEEAELKVNCCVYFLSNNHVFVVDS